MNIGCINNNSADTDIPSPVINYYSIIHITNLGDNKYEFGDIIKTNVLTKRDLLKIIFEDPNYVYYIIEHIDDYINDYSEDELINIMDTDDPLLIPLYAQLYENLYQSSDNVVDEFFDKIENTQYNPPIFFVQKHGSNTTFINFCTNSTFEF